MNPLASARPQASRSVGDWLALFVALLVTGISVPAGMTHAARDISSPTFGYDETSASETHGAAVHERMSSGECGSCAERDVKDFMIRHQRMLGLSPEDVRRLQVLMEAGL